MLRYHKMILQNILCQFTKFVLGDLKYFPDVTCYHSHCDIRTHFAYGCVYDMGTGTHFIHQLQCLAAPVPPFDQAHTLPQHGHINVTFIYVAAATCGQRYPYSLLRSTIVHSCPHSIHLVVFCRVIFYCSLVPLLDNYVEN